MQPLKLDYQADGHKAWIGMTVLGAGLAAVLSLAWNYQEDDRNLSLLEAQLANMTSKGAAATLALNADGRNAEQVAQEIKQANATILELSLPWKELFEAFESSRNSDVAVLTIEPDAQKGLVRIGAEAKSLNSLLDYMAYLQKIPFFKEVSLLNHQIQDQDPQKPVRFMIQASWGVQR